MTPLSIQVPANAPISKRMSMALMAERILYTMLSNICFMGTFSIIPITLATAADNKRAIWLAPEVAISPKNITFSTSNTISTKMGNKACKSEGSFASGCILSSM